MHTIRRSRHSRAPTIPLHNNTTLTSFVPVSRFPFRGCVGPRNASSKRPGIRRVSAGCVSVIDIARYGLVRQLTLTSPRPRRAPRQEPYLLDEVRSTVRLGRRQAAPTDARISRRGQPSCRFFPHPTARISPPPLWQRRGPVAIAASVGPSEATAPSAASAPRAAVLPGPTVPPITPSTRPTRSPVCFPTGSLFLSVGSLGTTLVSISDAKDGAAAHHTGPH
ncbi:hypothetical protein GW17_00001901 [Ensete ventricosum]|nr:hypothetical protein GW17_00001901 [Ensete ventricosum]RZS25140.1 hypothetical protein BHM03_00058304 [Ensete ventricosum]